MTNPTTTLLANVEDISHLADEDYWHSFVDSPQSLGHVEVIETLPHDCLEADDYDEDGEVCEPVPGWEWEARVFRRCELRGYPLAGLT